MSVQNLSLGSLYFSLSNCRRWLDCFIIKVPFGEPITAFISGLERLVRSSEVCGQKDKRMQIVTYSGLRLSDDDPEFPAQDEETPSSVRGRLYGNRKYDSLTIFWDNITMLNIPLHFAPWPDALPLAYLFHFRFVFVYQLSQVNIYSFNLPMLLDCCCLVHVTYTGFHAETCLIACILTTTTIEWKSFNINMYQHLGNYYNLPG